MHLQELLSYDDIIVQCHDNPDADAISSGYALWFYLRLKGKNVRFIYSGRNAITKSNLVLLKDTYHIPIEYVTELEEEPELLVTVDCQYGERNVSSFPAKHVAVIDHHQAASTVPEGALGEVRSAYGSCATILWSMLMDEGIDVNDCNAQTCTVSKENADRSLATSLYYGLYTDTAKLQEVSHPRDRDMRDRLKVNDGDIFLFQNANLSLEELKIAGQALESYHYDGAHRFAIVESKPCDPNILGVISDMLIEVDVVDTCIVYNVLGDGVKFSVRSCVPDVRANELAAYVARGLGGGGGHLRKAGGRLSADALLKAMNPGAEPVFSESAVAGCAHGMFSMRVASYFAETQVLDACADAGDGKDAYGARKRPPSLTDAPVYRKIATEQGYVDTAQAFGEGCDVLVRMLEGEFTIRTGHTVCIMIGVDFETYPIERSVLEKKYHLTEEPYDLFTGEYPPTVHNQTTGEVEDLLVHAKKCVSLDSDTSTVYALELDRITKLFTRWSRDKYMLGEKGDYLVASTADPEDAYIVKQEIFHKIYRKAEA